MSKRHCESVITMQLAFARPVGNEINLTLFEMNSSIRSRAPAIVGYRYEVLPGCAVRDGEGGILKTWIVARGETARHTNGIFFF